MTDHIAWGVKAIDPLAGEAQGADRRTSGTLARWLNSTTNESPRSGGTPNTEPAALDADAVEPFTHLADRLSRTSQPVSATSLPARSIEGSSEGGGDAGATKPVGNGEADDIFTRVANRLAKRAAAPSRPTSPARGDLDRTTPDGSEEAGTRAVHDLLGTVTRRLEAIESKLDGGRAAEPLKSAIEKIDDRLESLSVALVRSPRSAPAEDMLRNFESRLAEIMLRLNQDTPSPAAPLDPDHADARDHATAGASKEASLHEPLRRRAEPAAQASAAQPPQEERETDAGEPTERDRFAAALAEIRARQVRLREEAERENRTKAFAKQETAPPATDTPRRSVELPGVPSGDDLTSRLDALARQIESTLASGNFPMSEIIQRLEQIDARIEHPQQRIHLNRVKDLLQAVAARLEADERNRLSPEALDALEDQLEHLARRVDEALRARPSDGAVDKKLGELEDRILDLISQVQAFQGSTTLSVEAAARAGVADALARLWDNLPPEIGSLKADLAELKSIYDRAEQRSHNTLTTVHGALERVIERLTLLEEELHVARTPEPTSQPFAKPAAASRGQSLSARDRIFDPRVEGKNVDAPIAAPPRASDRDDGRPVPSSDADVKAGFIAAARRAARAATQETATAPAAKPSDAVAAVARGRGASLIERLRQAPSGRRHLLLGLAALVLAVGATQLILHMQRGPTPDPLFATMAKPAMDSDVSTGTRFAGADKPAESAVGNPFATDPNDTSVTGSIKPEADASAGAPKAPAVAKAEAPPAIVTAVPAQLLASVPATVDAPALRAAAERGDAAAVYELAARLADGRGMTRDPQLAAQLFEAQAEAGFVPAEYRIASHYEKGFGVDRDLGKAQSWYLKAAEGGNAKAMHNLAVLFAEGVSGKPDYAAAAQWFRKAAEFGVHDSQFNLAILAARGLGMPVDLVQAYTWFTILANSGDQDAAGKRDSIGARLSPTDLATARAAAERWQPKTPDPAANTVEPSASWGNTTSGDAKAAGSSKSRA
jgi:localization factor PodJL